MIEIRRCKNRDFKAIFPLLKQLWPEKRLNEKRLNSVFKKGLESTSQIYLCAAANKDIVGFCSSSVKNNLWQEGNMAHIDELVVDENHRNNGIGSLLLEAVTKEAIKRNCRRIELDSAFHRKKAHKFYEKNDYVKRAYLFSRILSR